MPFDNPSPKLSALDVALAQIEAKGAQRALEKREDAATVSLLVEKIIAANQAPELGSGLSGALTVVLSMRCPKTAKRKAAETINRLRVNRIACKRHGRNHRVADARLLRRVRILRECAIEFAEEARNA